MFDRLRRWLAGSPPLPEAERLRLEAWVRLRFQLASSDPTAQIIAAAGRLIDAGIEPDGGIDPAWRSVTFYGNITVGNGRAMKGSASQEILDLIRALQSEGRL